MPPRRNTKDPGGSAPADQAPAARTTRSRANALSKDENIQQGQNASSQLTTLPNDGEGTDVQYPDVQYPGAQSGGLSSCDSGQGNKNSRHENATGSIANPKMVSSGAARTASVVPTSVSQHTPVAADGDTVMAPAPQSAGAMLAVMNTTSAATGPVTESIPIMRTGPPRGIKPDAPKPATAPTVRQESSWPDSGGELSRLALFHFTSVLTYARVRLRVTPASCLFDFASEIERYHLFDFASQRPLSSACTI
jgi:hypothetical protein